VASRRLPALHNSLFPDAHFPTMSSSVHGVSLDGGLHYWFPKHSASHSRTLRASFWCWLSLLSALSCRPLKLGLMGMTSIPHYERRCQLATSAGGPRVASSYLLESSARLSTRVSIRDPRKAEGARPMERSAPGRGVRFAGRSLDFAGASEGPTDLDLFGARAARAHTQGHPLKDRKFRGRSRCPKNSATGVITRVFAVV